MLPLAPTCPECLSRSTKWLPATSDSVYVDYFRCERCACVWVVGDGLDDTRLITPTKTKRTRPALLFLYVDLDAGLMFAKLAQDPEFADRQRILKAKSQKVYDAVMRFLPIVDMPDSDHDRLCLGLQTLNDEIAKIPV